MNPMVLYVIIKILKNLISYYANDGLCEIYDNVFLHVSILMQDNSCAAFVKPRIGEL